MNMEFYRPESSIAFIIIGFLIFFIFRTHLLRKKYSELLHTSKTLEISTTLKLPRNRILKEILFILGIAFVALSLMRPRWGEKKSIKKVTGSDLCIALDLSQSMLAEDMSPNRLEYAKRELILLLENLNETKVTLVGFAGGAFISAPLTSDLDAIADYLTPINQSYVSLPSTFIQGAVITCTEALGYKDITDRNSEDEKENTAGSILLVTDGDDSSKIDSDIIKGLQKHKIPINTLLVGKNQGIFMPQKDKDGRISGFLKDPETGAPAKTKAEKEFASSLAEKTNGKLYVAQESANFEKIFPEELKKFESKINKEGVEVEKEEKFQFPLIIGIILLFIEWIITETGGVIPFYKNKFLKHGIKIVFLISFFIHKNLDAAGIFDIVRNNFGVFLFNQEHFSESQEHFERILEGHADEKQYLFNWISARLKQIETNQSTNQSNDESDSPPSLQEALEMTKIIETLAQKETDPAMKKKWLYQLAQTFEISKKTTEAIDSYYKALSDPPSTILDTMSRHNLARLLKENSQSNKNGSGSGKGGQGKSGGQGDSGKGKDQNEEKKKPQDYKGQNYTSDQVKQIMQNVGSEERNVIKKKSKNEAQKKGNEWGKQNGSSKPW